jgi:hypothetical protein
VTSAAKKAIQPAPTSTPEIMVSQPVIYEPTEIPTPIPIIDPLIEFYQSGGHDLGVPWTIIRDNVSGQKDLMVRTVVYDYRFMSYYDWWSVSWAQYFINMPEPGNKYLFIFVASWMPGIDPSMDPSFWGFGPDNFVVKYKGNLTKTDTSYPLPARIKQLEETWDYPFNSGRGKERIGPYGYTVIQDRGTGHIHAEPKQWMRMGESNGWSGFMIVVVPEDAKPEDIDVSLIAGGFGNAHWSLTK